MGIHFVEFYTEQRVQERYQEAKRERGLPRRPGTDRVMLASVGVLIFLGSLVAML